MKFPPLFYAILILLIAGGISCREGFSRKNRVVVVQPFSDFPKDQAQMIFTRLRLLVRNAVLREPVPLPASAYYAPHNRYRADELIAFLDKYGDKDTVVIGLTSKDISTTKGKVADWGIMGLASRPGNACIVSSFRLEKRSISAQLFKVAIHELGHTQGLPHCEKRTCFMKDAEGGNPIDSETDFCTRCKAFLIRKGWRLK